MALLIDFEIFHLTHKRPTRAADGYFVLLLRPTGRCGRFRAGETASRYRSYSIGIWTTSFTVISHYRSGATAPAIAFRISNHCLVFPTPSAACGRRIGVIAHVAKTTLQIACMRTCGRPYAAGYAFFLESQMRPPCN